MSDYRDSNGGTMPPMAESANHSPQALEGTGTTEVSNSRAFAKDRMHVLSVGAEPVRVLFGSSVATGSDVPAAGGAIIPANTLFTFRSSLKALYVYVEAADGASAFQASVWQRD